MVDDAGEIEIDDDDLQIDTYRAQGAGGQHVNKTDSAVRITHRPTRHRRAVPERALAVLRTRRPRWRCCARGSPSSRSASAARRSRRERGEAQDVNFGSQIRSYVLHPYTMVKDHRTNYEMGDANRVLDGDLDGFVRAELLEGAKDDAPRPSAGSEAPPARRPQAPPMDAELESRSTGRSPRTWATATRPPPPPSPRTPAPRATVIQKAPGVIFGLDGRRGGLPAARPRRAHRAARPPRASGARPGAGRSRSTAARGRCSTAERTALNFLGRLSGRRHADRALRARRRTARRRARPRHPQDDARPAGGSRRRRSPPAAASTTASGSTTRSSSRRTTSRRPAGWARRCARARAARPDLPLEVEVPRRARGRRGARRGRAAAAARQHGRPSELRAAVAAHRRSARELEAERRRTS